MTALTPAITSAKNWLANNAGSSLEMASTTAPRRAVASDRAAVFGTYPSSSIARCTASRDFVLTCGALLITRDTVPVDTPARRATSSSVDGRLLIVLASPWSIGRSA